MLLLSQNKSLLVSLQRLASDTLPYFWLSEFILVMSSLYIFNMFAVVKEEGTWFTFSWLSMADIFQLLLSVSFLLPCLLMSSHLWLQTCFWSFSVATRSWIWQVAVWSTLVCSVLCCFGVVWHGTQLRLCVGQCPLLTPWPLLNLLCAIWSSICWIQSSNHLHSTFWWWLKHYYKGCITPPT